jgi:Flp pilus assembly protein TadG
VIRRDERGTAAVEFAVVVPLVAIAMLVVVQVALLVGDQLTLAHAAREGAREASVWNDDGRARDAVLRAGRLDPGATEVEVSPSDRVVGTPVTVTVRYRPPQRVPFVGAFVPDDVELSASATMRTERDPDA